MAQDTYPDADDIYARIEAIQLIIEPLSASPNVPAASVTDYPYWIMKQIDTKSPQESRGNYKIDFAFEMVLVRGTHETISQSISMQKEILADQINITKEFRRRLNLTSDSYPDMPQNYRPNSLNVVARYMPLASGKAGSLALITFSYDVTVSENEQC